MLVVVVLCCFEQKEPLCEDTVGNFTFSDLILKVACV